MDEEEHALAGFLNDRLDRLGLDAETYAPYLLPLLTEEEKDDEEWESVMELLQASSESHSDDNQAWEDLRRDIEQAWATHKEDLEKLERVAGEKRVMEMEEKLAEEKREVEEALAEAERKKSEEHAVGDGAGIDAAKRALVARYAFEDDENEGGDEGAPTNKEVAAQEKQEKGRELRGQSVQTKKEEQTKTKEANLQKARLKEDRRKRAVKGERKR
jgi:hypothetical protein